MSKLKVWTVSGAIILKKSLEVMAGLESYGNGFPGLKSNLARCLERRSGVWRKLIGWILALVTANERQAGGILRDLTGDLRSECECCPLQVSPGCSAAITQREACPLWAPVVHPVISFGLKDRTTFSAQAAVETSGGQRGSRCCSHDDHNESGVGQFGQMLGPC